MGTLFRLATAFAAGAAAMYYFDPLAGRRRRALVRDKGVSMRHDLEDYAETRSKHAADRMQGAAARVRARMDDRPLSDHQLHERIRSKLGRLVEHPHQVTVEVMEGQVVLSGPISDDESEQLIDTVAEMQGVESVECRMTGPDTGMGETGLGESTETGTHQSPRH